MSEKDPVWKPRRQHKRHTYYKVQWFDKVSLTWRDEKESFDSVDEANQIRLTKYEGKQSRIMVVEGRKRYPLVEE